MCCGSWPIKWPTAPADYRDSHSRAFLLPVVYERRGMAATTALASAAEIPDSRVERNCQLFRACPPGVERSIRNKIRSAVVKSEADDDEQNWAACSTAMLINTDPGVGYIDAPTGLQPASYYRDLTNHPNILATFVYTARRRAGFVPSVMGQELSQEESKDYTNKFNAWLSELDAFWFYVTLTNNEVETLPNDSNTSDAIVDALSKFVLKNSDEINEVEAAEVTQRITKTFGLATEYMVEKNIPEGTTNPAQVVKAAFQHEAFGSPGPSNPSIPISFTTTTLSKTKENSIQYQFTTMNRFTFRLNSTNIIANAEALATGTTLVSTKAYCDYINGPLDEWAKDLIDASA